MGIKKIQTKDGVKLKNTKTGKMAGSIGKGKEAPTPISKKVKQASLTCSRKQCPNPRNQESLFCGSECRSLAGYKQCGKCQGECLATDFIPRANWCRACLKIYNRELYLVRKALPTSDQFLINESVRLGKMARSKEARSHHKEWLRRNTCVVCGENDVCVLESDHIDPSDKEENMTALVSNGHVDERYLSERAKTRVMCANCHRIRTHVQVNSWLVNGKLNKEIVPYSVKGTDASLRVIDQISVIELTNEMCWQCRVVETSLSRRYCSLECMKLARQAEIRYCGSCDRELPQEQFGGKDPKCIECRHAFGREHYLAHKTYYSEKGKRGRATRALLNRKNSVDYLSTHPCIGMKPNGQLCQESRIGVLDFDHRDGAIKIDAIANMVRQGIPWSRIEAEIAKCDVLCANCHRRRTHKQQGDWASKSECPDHRDANDDAPPLVRRPRNRDYPKL